MAPCPMRRAAPEHTRTVRAGVPLTCRPPTYNGVADPKLDRGGRRPCRSISSPWTASLTRKRSSLSAIRRPSGYMWLNANRNFKGNLYSVQIDPNEIPVIEEMGDQELHEPRRRARAYRLCHRRRSPRRGLRIVADCIQTRSGVRPCSPQDSPRPAPRGHRGSREAVHHGQRGGLGPHRPQLHGLVQPCPGALLLGGPARVRGRQRRLRQPEWLPRHLRRPGGAENGIKLSKIVSFGNGIVLENADYLEYLAHDRQNKVIGMYVEGCGMEDASSRF